jgi:hypothetical protein
MNIRLTISGIMLLQVLSSCFLNPANTPLVKTGTIKAVKVGLHPISKPHDTLCIAAVGDIMLGTSYPNTNTLAPDSARHSFDAALPYLQQADVTMGNLEGTLLDGGSPAHYKTHLKSTAYLFRMPSYYSGVLKQAGFSVLSLANNHTGDFGENGRTSTMRILDSVGIAYGGQLSHPTAIFTVKGVKYGFCSFAPNSQTLPILELQTVKQIVADLKSQCDILIVSFHGGGEGPAFEHVTRRMESYMGALRGNVHAFAHTAVDAGADMVLGNGPHVSRGIELYKNRLIAYSLGTFCTYKSVSVEGVSGLAPLLKIYINKKGEFLNGRLLAFKQTHADGLVRDSANKVIARIKYLTDIDFPQSGLNIAEDGVITPLPQNVVVAAGMQ